MSFIGDALTGVKDFAIHTLQTTGYAGLFLLMAAESMVFPVPSEAVMPFAGVLVHDGTFSWAGAILASSAGSLLGSYLSYLLGQYGFLPLVRKYGKYVLVQEHHVEKAQQFFAKRGMFAVFACRFVPGVRHVSSIPAGAARMPLGPFLAMSVLGATLWNTILLWAGYKVADSPGIVDAIKRSMDLVGVILFGILVVYVVYEVQKARKAKRAKDEQPPTPPTT